MVFCLFVFFDHIATHSESCCCSVTQSCLTHCHRMDCSMPGFLVLYYLPELAQTHVHWVGDAIWPSHPLSPSLPALNLSQYQGLFQWVGSLHQVAEYWSLSFSISPSSEYSGLISFSILSNTKKFHFRKKPQMSSFVVKASSLFAAPAVRFWVERWGGVT